MAPERIGKYEIIGTLGHGAMGEVFRARDTVLNREVAVKRIAANLAADETVRKRFQREAQSVARLSHPNVITIYELGFEKDQLYMAMELLEGQNLKQALAQRTLSMERRLDIVEQVLEGLAYAHRRGVVHRDLKPANIHLVPRPDRPKVKIVDFGLAKVSGSDMTSTGTIMGTPHYMSPEQVRGQKADTRSDVFSAGAVLYEVLSGRKPFDAESMHAVLFKVIQDEPPPLGEVAPGVPPTLVKVVEKALAKDPAARFEDAGQMLVALRQARHAATLGTAGEPLPEFERTILVSPKAAEASASRSRPATVPPAPSMFTAAAPEASSSRRNLLLGIAFGLLLAAGGGLGAWRLLSRPAAASGTSEIQSLTRAVVDRYLEVARRRLEAGDAAEAVRQAERALKLDPDNAEVQRTLDEGRAAQKRADKARERLHAAGDDRTAAAAAAFELMQADPTDGEADRAAAAAGAAFRPHAREAQRRARQARADAERAGGGQTTTFEDAAALVRRGEQALGDGDQAAAAHRFLEAERLFARSQSRK